MALDELALRRASNARRVAGARRHPPPEPELMPGDADVILVDLRQIDGMTEEVLAEARVLGDNLLIETVDQVRMALADALDQAVRVAGGGE